MTADADSPPATGRAPGRFLILPGDPVRPGGSLGDLAMLSGLMQSLLSRDSTAGFTVVGAHADRIDVPGAGCVEVAPAWLEISGTVAFDRIVRGHRRLFVIGADVLDGFYGAAQVCRFVAYCNHAARLGIPVTILGFSFNNQPRAPAVRALSRLHPEVRVNVRGRVSFERFRKAVGVPATICADVAFLMPPAREGDAPAEEWIRRARAAGRVPVGVNLGAHAFADALGRMGAGAVVAGIARQLAAAGARERLEFLLLPHDMRRESGDTILLQGLESALRACGFSQARYAAIADPARVKRVVGQLDLVVTARMHLAIASLGMGTPVVLVPYQDKFEDLLDHFELPAEDMIQPESCFTDELSRRLSGAIVRRTASRGKIEQRLPGVMELARLNLAAGKVG
jgi:polysaccharide pyruvyl transferase WcaK-like protein